MTDAPPKGTVDLWVASPPDLARSPRWPELLELMTAEERVKHKQYVFGKNRHEYVTTRALARLALAPYLGAAPASLAFARTERGRPYLVPPGRLLFNLSNHPTLVVCAVSHGAEIGADVEPRDRGPEILTVATTVFSPEELEALGGLEGEAKELRAVSLWTSKEAYLKARGMGLSMPLERITVRFPDAERPTLALSPPVDDDASRWALRIVDVRGHRIALCVEGTLDSVRIRHLEDGVA